MKYLVILLWSVLLGAGVAHAQSGYRISSGDTLEVEVLEDPSLNRNVLVLPDGSINFPFAGTLPAAGRTVAQVQQAITSGIDQNFAATPTVFVTVGSIRETPPAPSVEQEAPTIDIFFTGEIGNPGRQAVEPGTTFMQAISLAGGFTNFAATKRIQLRRDEPDGTPRVYTINYRSLSQGARLSRSIVLADGDVILVPERGLFE